MATTPASRPGEAIRARVEAQIAAARQRAMQQAAAARQRAEAMHTNMGATEAALQGLGSHIIHDFTTNPQAAADQLRSTLEGVISRAQQSGVKVNVTNTGGKTKYGTG